MKNRTYTSMTEGKPFKVLFHFVIPLILSGLFQQLYSIVDSIIVGRYVSTDALAAVGMSANSIIVFFIISGGLGLGSSIAISQIFGKKDMKELKTMLSTLIIFSLILGALLSCIGVAISKWYLIRIKAPANLMEDSLVYFRIYIGGLIFIMLYEILIFIFTSLGNARLPLFLLIISSVLNVVLDLLFVVDLHWDVAGAAIATVLSQGITALLGFMILMKQLSAMKTASFTYFSLPSLKNILGLSIPTMIQQAVVTSGIVIIQVFVNSFGTDIIAGFTVANRLQALFMVPFINISQAAATFTAQNLGAGNIRRIWEGKRTAIKLSLVFYLPVLLLIFVLGSGIIELFLDPAANADVKEAGLLYLYVIAPFFMIASCKYSSDAVLRGIGKMKLYLISSLSDFAIRVLASYLMVQLMKHFAAIPIATVIGWIVGLFISNTLLRSQNNLLCSDGACSTNGLPL